jgi:hypothetical protein
MAEAYRRSRKVREHRGSYYGRYQKGKETRRRNRKRTEVSRYYWEEVARYEVIDRREETSSPAVRKEVRIPGRGDLAVTVCFQ